MSIRKALFPLAGLLLVASSLFAQAKGGGATAGSSQVVTIRGRVVDAETGSPILDARIALIGMAGGAGLGGSSTIVGSDFEFDSIPTGLYEIAVEADGYQNIRQPMQTTSSMTSYITIPMRKSATGQRSPAGKTVTSRLLQLPGPAREAYQSGMALLYDKHDPEKSLPFFQKTLKLAPSFYEANYQLGVAYENLKRTPEATAALQEAQKSSGGKFAPAEVALASVLSEQQKYADAEAAARQGVEGEPKSGAAHYELARALLGQGKSEEAETEAKASLEQTKNLPQNYLLLAGICANRGDTAAAIQDLDDYLKAMPDGSLSDNVRTLRDTLNKQMPQAKDAPPQPVKP
jgi:tetratricopeptide (TPR) repeat protein